MDDIQESLSTMTDIQAVMYNQIITEFTMNEIESVKPKGYLRLGQAFYNYAFKKGLVKGSFPELFYCEDKDKAREMITRFVCSYIKDKY